MANKTLFFALLCVFITSGLAVNFEESVTVDIKYSQINDENKPEFKSQAVEWQVDGKPMKFSFGFKSFFNTAILQMVIYTEAPNKDDKYIFVAEGDFILINQKDKTKNLARAYREQFSFDWPNSTAQFFLKKEELIKQGFYDQEKDVLQMTITLKKTS